MSIHLASPCNQCYYYKKCNNQKKLIRANKQKEWLENNKVIGMNTTDCFKSNEEYKRDFDNLPQWKKEELTKCHNLSCWGSYDGSANQCMSHCKGWKECSMETSI